MLNERTRRIQDSLKEAEQVKEQLARATKITTRSWRRRGRRPARFWRRRRSAPSFRKPRSSRRRARKLDRIRSDAREQAVQERDGLMRDLKNQMADLVTATASRVLGAELKSNHDQLIEESLASLGRQN